MKRTLAAAVIAISLIAPAAPAQAADVEPTVPVDMTIGDVTVAPGVSETIVLDETEISTAREEAIEAAETGLSVADTALRDQLVRESEEIGGTIDPASVDVVDLLDGDVVLAVPTTIEVEEIVVTVDGLSVEVEATANQIDEALATGGNPGSAPYWANNGDGSYKLVVSGWGDALFTWRRDKLMNDGSASYTWYAYRRKGDAHPYDRNLAPDARVSILRIQSYPYDSIEPGLVAWSDWEPSADFTGQCGGHVYEAGVNVPYAGITISFQDCDRYDVWRNVDKPGSYWIQMDQGAVINSGSRQIGYSVAWKAREGTAGSQHDFQRVKFYLSGSFETCDAYDASKTCAP